MNYFFRWTLLSALVISAPLRVPLHAQTTAASAITAPQETLKHVWKLSAPAETKSVHLAGDFNGWNATKTPLTRQNDGSWSVALNLAPGKYLYKFVLDGTKWIVDPNATHNENDGSGNQNSVLLLLASDFAQPARVDDGIIARSALWHPREYPQLNWDRGELTLSLRTRANDLSQVLARIDGRELLMQRAESDEWYQWYRTQIAWDRKRDVYYSFELHDGSARKYFGANGVQNNARNATNFVLSAKEFQPFWVPNWVEQSVFYQIFPDRFANGDTKNDPQDVQKWDAAPTYSNRFGGDAVGVQEHLPYLQKLGVGAVYFNPVFQSPSNHRYDAQDYQKIDREFGTNAEFAVLTHAMKARGIRTVMDFVFNHSATTFAPFADVRAKGAASKYKDWYFIHDFPVRVQEKPNYEAWYGYPSMPKLNVLNPPTRDYLLGLVNFWHDAAGVEGLRLDVANEVAPAFWRLLRARAKSVDPQMWIVGEQWGSAAPWLRGDQWDAAMNYPFRDACLQFFAQSKSKPSQFTEKLMDLRRAYGPQVSRDMMNLLSSHDTPRFFTLCGENAKLHQLAATLQFTWIGAPSIYYGEELGMSGGADPDNRRPMRWDLANDQNEMLRFYRRLIAIRQQNRVLQSGDVQVLATDDAANSFAFARTLEKETAVLAFNRSDQTQTLNIALPSNVKESRWKDALSETQIIAAKGNLSVTLAPLSAAILLPLR